MIKGTDDLVTAANGQKTLDRSERVKKARRAKAVGSAKRWGAKPLQKDVTERGPARPVVGAETTDRQSKYAQREALRKVVNTPAYREARETMERIIGINDLVDLPPNEQAQKAGRPVARIVTLPQNNMLPEGFATGFLVAPDVLMTNHHVFRAASEAVGTGAQFLYEKVAGGLRQGVLFELDPDRFFVNDEQLDYALVAVKPKALDGTALSTMHFLPLIAEEGKIQKGDPVNIIQHPDGRPKEYAMVNNHLLDLTPDGFMLYETDTEPGSSGSWVANQYWETVGLHHSGVPEMRNGKLVMKSGDLVEPDEEVDDDQIVWIANEGIRVSAIVTSLRSKRLADPAQQAMLEGLLSTTRDPLKIVAETAPQSAPGTLNDGAAAAQNVFHFHAPVTINIDQRRATLPLAPAPVAPLQPALPTPTVMPEKTLVFDEDYDNREGYVAKNFLAGQTIPAPTVVASRKGELLKDEDGDPWVVPYYHYSLVMNVPRRLVMWTANNVDYTPSRRGEKTRAEYGGENWRLDPRIEAAAPGLQIKNVEFYKPATKIDRGHIVRREDNCWGTTEAIASFANSDTYHWSNCTIQHEAFNQSGKDGIWGAFEEHIASEVRAEGNRMVVFAGPVLDPDDPLKGYDHGKIKVPMRFWKVVACLSKEGNAKKLFAYGFIFDQTKPIREKGYERMDMTDYEIQQVPLKDITKDSGVVFADILLIADVLKGDGANEARGRRREPIKKLSDLVLK